MEILELKYILPNFFFLNHALNLIGKWTLQKKRVGKPENKIIETIQDKRERLKKEVNGLMDLLDDIKQ